VLVSSGTLHVDGDAYAIKPGPYSR
jgi:hypothetical protein